MVPKRSSLDLSDDVNYPGILQKLCKQEDVLVIPQFVVRISDQRSESVSPRKTKDSKTGEKLRSRLGISRVDVNLEPSSVEDGPRACDSLRTPQVLIFYEMFEDKESPAVVLCKNFYVENSLIRAIGKSLAYSPTVRSIKIENCCIEKEVAETLALVLAEESGRQITDLSLDGNPDVVDVLPLFVSFPTGLRYLSLRKCGLDDAALKIFAPVLSSSYEGDRHVLRVLDLGMNKIGDEGVLHLANALRTNRTLVSLCLSGNQIGDEGVFYLVEVLQKFPLTHEEVKLKRRRIFDEIVQRKRIFERLLAERKTKGERDSRNSFKSPERSPWTGRKIRGNDGKLRCVSNRDKRAKSGSVKVNPGEKFRGKLRNGLEEIGIGASELADSSELLAVWQQVDAEMLPDRHPFVAEISKSKGELWCDGCWSLGNINLSYNYLTDKVVEKFLQVLIYQEENFKLPKVGLARLILLPGNSIRDDSPEFESLQNTLSYRLTKKEHSESSAHAPGVSSSSVRKSSSAKLTKNR